MQLNPHILEVQSPTLGMKTFFICPLLTYCLLSFCPRVSFPFLFFFVFFAVEVLLFLPSIKKTKAWMKINAKKTNSTSENAIQSSYFVLALRKHSHTQTLRSGKHCFYFKSTQSFAWVRTEIEIFHPRNPFTALEQKRLELRSFLPTLPNLWFTSYMYFSMIFAK